MIAITFWSFSAGAPSAWCGWLCAGWGTLRPNSGSAQSAHSIRAQSLTRISKTGPKVSLRNLMRCSPLLGAHGRMFA